MDYEKVPKTRCVKCGQPQFLKQNQLHTEGSNGERVTVFLCKYCGCTQPHVGNGKTS